MIQLFITKNIPDIILRIYFLQYIFSSLWLIHKLFIYFLIAYHSLIQSPVSCQNLHESSNPLSRIPIYIPILYCSHIRCINFLILQIHNKKRYHYSLIEFSTTSLIIGYKIADKLYLPTLHITKGTDYWISL